MLKKRVLALILAFAMLSVFSAAGHAVEGALRAAPVSAEPGEQVQIAVMLQNPGIVGMRIFIAYDASALRLDKAENGTVFGAGHGTFGNDLTLNPYTMIWDDSLRHDNITDSGLLFTLTFTVLDDAPTGETKVSIETDDNSTFDVDLEKAAVADTECVVTVRRSDPQPAVCPTLTIRQPYNSTLNYGYALTLYAEAADLPDGAVVEWSVNGDAVQIRGGTRGMRCTVKSVRTGDVTVTARLLAADGKALTDANGEPITASLQLHSKAGLWQKIIYYFRELCNILFDIGIDYLIAQGN